MKKRFVSLFMTFVLLVSTLLCFNATAAYADDSGKCGSSSSIFGTGNNASYTYVEATKTLTISGTGATKDYGDTVLNRPPWYDYKTEIETVIVEEGIENIGTLNFYGFTSLKSVSLPSTLKTISGSPSVGDVSAAQYGAFTNCTALEQITLPQGLTTIEPKAFNGCTSLKSITFPDSLTTLGDGAFMDCTSLESVTYGTGLTSTGVRAFYNSGVKTVVFSPTITSIDEYSFFGSKITQIEIPEQITSIGTRAFANSTFINSVTVYNPNLVFGGIEIGEKDPFSGSSQSITFYGHKGSTTETFVNDHPNNAYTFVSIDPCDHTSTHEVVEIEPTCVTEGLTTQVCDECGFVVSQTTLEALGHDWQLVDTLDETEENGHIIRGYVCSRCSEEKSEIEHVAFVEGFYDYENTATCTEPGLETYTCTFEGCGKVQRIPVLIPRHTVEEYTVTVEPTCTEKGEEQGVCIYCGEIITQEIPAKGHTNVLTSEYDNTAQDGHTYQVFTCSECGTETKVPTHVEWKDNYYTSTTLLEPTCTIDGLRRDVCSVEGCGETRTEAIPANGQHEWIETTRTEPTCTADGRIYYACKNCNMTKYETIDALGHDYVLQSESSVAPTCTDTGYNTYICSVCGAKDTKILNATGHTPDENDYTVITQPDCENDGLAETVCLTCSTRYQVTLEALGHDYEDVLTPIEDKPGHSLSTPTCTRCGATQSAQTVHNEWIDGYYDTTVITEGSCTVARITNDTCTICGETRVNTTPAPGHDYTYLGLNDENRLSYHCEVCGNDYTASPSATFAIWNSSLINTAPNDTLMGYLFDFTNDGIINIKDYSYLLRVNKSLQVTTPA